MNFSDIEKMSDTNEKVSAIYEIFDEDKRLQSRHGRVEFLTTVHYLEKVVKPGMKILDLGAGTGVYSLYFAEKGYEVTAVELAERNCEVFKTKIKDNHKIDLHHGSALDLSFIEDKSFDVVLLFGPLYHLESETDRNLCLQEAKRVLKDDGTIFVAYISHDMIFMTEMTYDVNQLEGDSYDHDTMRIKNFPFVFFKLEECEEMLEKNGFIIDKEIASDGFSELMAKQLSEMSDKSYEQYLKYHFYRAEKKELLGATNHFLFECHKK